MSECKHEVWAEFEGKRYDLTHAWITFFQNPARCSCCESEFTGPGYALGGLTGGQLCSECMTSHMKAAGYIPLAGGVFREPADEPEKKRWKLQLEITRTKRSMLQNVLHVMLLLGAIFWLGAGLYYKDARYYGLAALFVCEYNSVRIKALERRLP